MPNISIIVPVFNEEKNIFLFYKELSTVLDALKGSYLFEIIFINDGSSDRSDKYIKRLTQKYTEVKYINFTKNFGKEIATSAGLHYCNGDAAIMIDSDLQHPVELIPDFIRKWEDGNDIVIGVTEANMSDSWFKRIGSYLFNQLIKFVGDTEITCNGNDFRIIDRKVIDAFKLFQERSRITRGLLEWLGFEKKYIEFTPNKRLHGKATYDLKKKIQLAFATLITHSLFPLKIAGYLGVGIMLFSTVLGTVFTLDRFLFSESWQLNISGTAFLAVLLLFLVGIILSSIHILGIYIANIHQEVIGRPLYVVGETQNFSKNK